MIDFNLKDLWDKGNERSQGMFNMYSLLYDGNFQLILDEYVFIPETPQSTEANATESSKACGGKLYNSTGQLVLADAIELVLPLIRNTYSKANTKGLHGGAPVVVDPVIGNPVVNAPVIVAPVSNINEYVVITKEQYKKLHEKLKKVRFVPSKDGPFSEITGLAKELSSMTSLVLTRSGKFESGQLDVNSNNEIILRYKNNVYIEVRDAHRVLNNMACMR